MRFAECTCCPSRASGGRRNGRAHTRCRDDPLNLKLIKNVLEYQGFDVLTATSGEDGVVAALSDSPDLVLMDLQLPGIDGHEALLRIRADPRRSRTPVRGGASAGPHAGQPDSQRH